jgi:glycerophosphodiester phosphodiesterase
MKKLFGTLSEVTDNTCNESKRGQKASGVHGIPPNFSDTVNLDEVDQNELHYLLGTFIELRDGLKKLQWYGKVNRDGFRKILRKLDKFRSGGSCLYPPYEGEPKLSNTQFASQTLGLKDLERINRLIADLTRAIFHGRSSSTHRSMRLDHFCAQFHSSFNSPNAAYHAIREDDASALDQLLQDQASEARAPSSSFQPLLLILLQCLILCESKTCIDKLLLRVRSLREDKFNIQDCLHLLVIKIGLEKTLTGPQGQQSLLQEPMDPINSDEVSLPLLNHVLDRLRHNQQPSLYEKDLFGRLPLHYAAQYGLVEACQVFLEYMQEWGLVHVPTAFGAILLQDSEGYPPLHLAVIGGHTAVTETLLDFHNRNNSTDKMADVRNLNTILGNLLAIALKSDFVEIVQLLVATDVNIDHQGTYGETALYIAARSGR